MAKRKYLTHAECAEKGWLNKSALKAERLKPAPEQRPVAEYWQGQGLVSVYDRALCIPMRPYKAPSDAQLAALKRGRSLLGTHACMTPDCTERVYTEDRMAYCQSCQDHKRLSGVSNVARQWLSQEPVILDTETTGLGANAEIIELALIDCEGRVLINSRLQPTENIEPEATAVHGITDEMLVDAPTISDFIPELMKHLKGRQAIIYNADFERRMLLQSAAKYGMASEEFAYVLDQSCQSCLMKLYARYRGEWNDKYGQYKWQSLESAAAQCGIRHDNAHNALADTQTALELLRNLAAS